MKNHVPNNKGSSGCHYSIHYLCNFPLKNRRVGVSVEIVVLVTEQSAKDTACSYPPPKKTVRIKSAEEHEKNIGSTFLAQS